ncbi:hypothetical protein ACFVZ2_14770, partial [Streptomyces lasiicapitis]
AGVCLSIPPPPPPARPRARLGPGSPRPTNPPRVDYRLTPLGEQIAGHLLALIHFVEGSQDEVIEAQRRYDDLGGR